MRKALDPRFQPDTESRQSMMSEAEANGLGRGRNGRRQAYTFEPNIKIQLVTTSDGKKLGGIRLSTLRPTVHRRKGQNGHAGWLPECPSPALANHGRALLTGCPSEAAFRALANHVCTARVAHGRPLIELIAAKPYGLMNLLDEEVRMPQGSDDKYLAKIVERQRASKAFGAPGDTTAIRPNTFLIRHYERTRESNPRPLQRESRRPVLAEAC